MSTRRGFLKGFGASILGVALGSRIAVEVAEAAPLLPPVKPTKLEPPDYIKQRMGRKTLVTVGETNWEPSNQEVDALAKSFGSAHNDLDGLQGGKSRRVVPRWEQQWSGHFYIGEYASCDDASRAWKKMCEDYDWYDQTIMFFHTKDEENPVWVRLDENSPWAALKGAVGA